MCPKHMRRFSCFVSASLFTEKTSFDFSVCGCVFILMRLVLVELPEEGQHLLMEIVDVRSIAPLPNGVLKRSSCKSSPVGPV